MRDALPALGGGAAAESARGAVAGGEARAQDGATGPVPHLHIIVTHFILLE